MHVIIRIEMDKEKVNIGKIATLINQHNADLIAIDVIRETSKQTIRDISIKVSNEAVQIKVIDALKETEGGVHVKHISDRTFLIHLGGKVRNSA
ncbi:malolactic enzyme [Gracilibacillus boraciitolerans JCM 21714]|uniref:Malolactic enzyme n=1 Tax=Gracilibacillus boraciitolerans JCM 21714 TaxID=1298598 RepID=W4VLD1_9BACI|nr:malolactic enzyme [Gracilibacillus boraciitolerans JCM 21714]